METFAEVSSRSDGDLAGLIQAAAPGAARREEAELCQRLGRRVRLFGLSRLRDRSIVDDLVQRVLMVVIQKLRAGEVSAPDKIASFALGTARNIGRELSRKGLDHLPEDGVVIDLMVTRFDPLAQQALGDCLRALPERERAVVALSFYHEQASTEIGEALGLTPGNVRVVRHRAIGQLRDCMGLGQREVAS